MPYKEKEFEKMFWPISEVAAMLNVNTSLIRYWENEFDVLRPSKNQKGDRSFTKRDVETLKMIYYLVKDKGYTLEGAKKVIKENRNKLDAHLELRNKLMDVRRFLQELKSALQ